MKKISIICLIFLGFFIMGCKHSNSKLITKENNKQSPQQVKVNNKNNIISKDKKPNFRKFITEEVAIEKVSNIPDVVNYMKNTDKVVFITEDFPTPRKPNYVIRIAEDLNDHLITYDFITLNSYTGKIISREFK